MYRKASLVVLLLSVLVAGYLLAGVVMNRTQAEGDQPYREMGVYTEVLQHINDDYVTTPNLNKVTDGALHGLLESLDSDSSYLSPAEYKAFLAARTHPSPASIGLLLSKRYGYANVVDVRPGSPADKAGISAGDFIESVSGASTRDLSLPEISFMLSGAPGTQVEMSVVRAHRAQPDKMEIVRQTLGPEPLTTRLFGSVGYIGIPSMIPGRSREMANAIHTLSRQGADKWVIDLRNTGTGSFREAEACANLFLGKGVITWAQGQTYPRRTVSAQPGETVTTAPLAVLVNAGTSGPAEVMAAAIKENARGQLVGDHTYGEGSIQKLIPMADGAALYLSIARYYGPNGKAIQEGLTPSVEQVRYAGALPDEDYPPEGVVPSNDDLQLDRAVVLLGGQAPKVTVPQ